MKLLVVKHKVIYLFFVAFFFFHFSFLKGWDMDLFSFGVFFNHISSMYVLHECLSLYMYVYTYIYMEVLGSILMDEIINQLSVVPI